jgi:hypothetical protein
MPWQYSQRKKELTYNGNLIGYGYSGKDGVWKDNPLMEMISNKGPIPRGQYRISKAHQHPTKGPITMSLTPVGHAAHGRTHFLIHGDSIKHPGNASEGCIILGRHFRARIAASGDTIINVVE